MTNLVGNLWQQMGDDFFYKVHVPGMANYKKILQPYATMFLLVAKLLLRI